MDVFKYFKHVRALQESTTSERAHELGYEYLSRGVWRDPKTGNEYKAKGTQFVPYERKVSGTRQPASGEDETKKSLGQFKQDAETSQQQSQPEPTALPQIPDGVSDAEFADAKAKEWTGGRKVSKDRKEFLKRAANTQVAMMKQPEEPIEEPVEEPAPEPEKEPEEKNPEDFRTIDDVMKTFKDFRKAAEPKRRGAKGDKEREEFAKKDAPESDGEEEIKRQKEIVAKTPNDAKQTINDLVKAHGIQGALEKQRAERAKRLGQKIKVSTSPVEQQEGNTLITFYNAIEKGKSLKDGGDMELFDMLNQNFPGMSTAPPAIKKQWYQNFLQQGQAMRDYLGMEDDEIDTDWEYERYGEGDTNFIPKEKQHNIMRDTWDNFTPAQKKVYGMKDSWNPADISMVRSDKKEEVQKQIAKLQDDFKDMDPELGPAMINSYMKDLAKQKILIPISLKQGDVEKGVKPKIGEYNYAGGVPGEDEEGNPQAVKTSFLPKQNPKTEMAVSTAGGKLGFDSHSMLMDPKFSIGGKDTSYRIENKTSSLTSDAFEIAELVKGKRANARGGGVPAPVMAKMIKDELGVEINDRMGLGKKQGSTEPFTDDDKKYYTDMFNELKDAKGEDGNEMFNFGKGLMWDRKEVSPDEYFSRLLDMANSNKDEGTGKSAELKFRLGVRTKLRQMKTMLAMKRAQDNGTLGNFISKLYYSAGKQNIDDEMKQGPFIKVQ